jgi:hypothetical protein
VCGVVLHFASRWKRSFSLRNEAATAGAEGQVAVSASPSATTSPCEATSVVAAVVAVAVVVVEYLLVAAARLWHFSVVAVAAMAVAATS